MKIRAWELIQLLFVTASFYVSYYFFPVMPERIATHWGVSGAANGWMPKAPGLYFMPGMSLFIFLAFFITARVNVKGRNIDGFRAAFEMFSAVILAVLLYVSCLMMAYNLDIRFNMGAALAPGFAALIFSLGKLMNESKINYLVGIRTSWTMQNEKVWDKTHKRGAVLFYAASVLVLTGTAFPDLLIFFMIIPLAVIMIYLSGYSKKIYEEEISKDDINKYLNGQ
jgi:uncharacterized membrane protein